MSRLQRFDWRARQRLGRRQGKSRVASYVVSPLTLRLHVEALEDRRMLAVVTVERRLEPIFGSAGAADR
jgi:hypothetical protein